MARFLKLERMEIHGFKSFYGRTRFDFPEGITAVVGPNGCGKSNIGDAISWVLGEQKASSLRSENMEDVIFNGSQGKKPLGMAEVSLHFKNIRARSADAACGTLDGAPVVASNAARFERVTVDAPFGLRTFENEPPMKTVLPTTSAAEPMPFVRHDATGVALNRTVAVAEVSGATQALAEVVQLERGGALAGYQYLPAIKADLLQRLGRTDEASVAYRQALELTRNEAEREFLAERLASSQISI